MSDLDVTLEEEVKRVEENLKRILFSKNKSMQKVMAWILGGEGKMLRPRFLLLCSHLGEKTTEDATEYAAVLEIIHMASLVHDDIIDNANMRRKRESVQKKFGKKMAVYAGDYMIFSALKDTNIAYNENVREFFRLFEEVCYGELGQNDFLFNVDVKEENYLNNIRGKTAAMFRTACRLGAILSDMDEEVIEAATLYGENIGILFQIHDDLLDCYVSDKITGKPAFQDVENGIYTLPILYMLEDEERKKQFLAIREKIRGRITKGQRKQILDLIKESNSLERCKKKSFELYEAAVSAVNIIENQEVLEKMNAFADALYKDIEKIMEV